MTPSDIAAVAGLCAERAGLQIDPEKPYRVENRLAPVARREGFGSVEELVRAVRHRAEERLVWALVEAMSPAETSFFRHPETFELVAEKVLPSLARSREGLPLRVWVAAGGTGQEVYSLAMLLAEHRIPGVSFELTASDLCERRLEKAQTGLYSPFEVQRGLSAHRLVRHFENAQDGFVLSPRIRAMVRWRRANLLEDLSRFGSFDLVLCRNHLTALTDSARARAVANLAAVLAPGGILALSPGETAPGFIATHGLSGFHTRPGDNRAAA